MKHLISKHNPQWQYLPTEWGEGAFLGNGYMGAMIYSGGQDQHRLKPNAVRWELGRVGITAKEDHSGYLVPRVLIGDFFLEPKGMIFGEAVSMELDLEKAECSGHIPTAKGHIRFSSFIHATQPLLIVELTGADQELEPVFNFYPQHCVSPWFHYKTGEALEKIPVPPKPELRQEDSTSYCIHRYLDDSCCVVAWQSLKVGQSIRLYITITEQGAEKEVLAQAREALSVGISEDWNVLRQKHQEWWQDHYSRSSVRLPDSLLEGFYWIQRYKMGSATRPDGPVLDILGPWMTLTPWPGVWWNLNAQFIYSPFYVSNHSDLAESLSRTLDQYRDNLIKNAPEEFQSDSAALGRASTYDCKASTQVGNELGNLTWVCHNLWRQFRTTMDMALLENLLFPILKQSINLYLHLLEEDAEGILHLPPTISPEYGGHLNLTTRDCHFDLALLRWGCNTLLEISRSYLEHPDSSEGRWEDTLSRLAPFPVNEDGFKVGDELTLEYGHRHFSHLMAGYPLWVLNRDNPDESELYQKSLRYWLNKGGALTGFTFGYAAAAYAHLRQGDKALACLKVLVEEYIKPNTHYLEKGPVLETPLQAADAIHDLLIQSNHGYIDIFPAIPSSWKNLSFENLAAEGAFLVSAVLEKGKTRFVRIHSLKGSPCIVRCAMVQPEVVDSEGQAKRLKQKDGHLLEIPLEAGQTVLLREAGNLEDFTLPDIEADPAFFHYFGSRKPWCGKV